MAKMGALKWCDRGEPYVLAPVVLRVSEPCTRKTCTHDFVTLFDKVQSKKLHRIYNVAYYMVLVYVVLVVLWWEKGWAVTTLVSYGAGSCTRLALLRRHIDPTDAWAARQLYQCSGAVV